MPTRSDLEARELDPVVLVDPAGRPTAANTPMGFVQQTSFSASTGLAPIPGGSSLAVIQVQTQPVRWRDDGTAPTTTVGMLLNPGDVLRYDGSLSAIRFIETAASAVLNISYYS